MQEFVQNLTRVVEDQRLLRDARRMVEEGLKPPESLRDVQERFMEEAGLRMDSDRGKRSKAVPFPS